MPSIAPDNSVPTIKMEFKADGFIRKIKQFTDGIIMEPQQFYIIYNNAKDPDGVHYWKFVNDGTGPKRSKGKAMVFFANGKLYAYKGVVGGNPAFRMREKVKPLLRSYLGNRLKKVTRKESMTLLRLENIFFDTMEYVKRQLENVTPEIQDNYYESGWTPEPGLLRDSYHIKATKANMNKMAGPDALSE